MIERRSAEEWLAEFEDTVRRYHLGKAAPASERLTQDEALARLRKLGFTVGEGLRLLRPKGATRAHI
jgi:hypothetical protein